MQLGSLMSAGSVGTNVELQSAIPYLLPLLPPRRTGLFWVTVHEAKITFLQQLGV